MSKYIETIKEVQIPDGFEAKIDGNKVIFVPKKSEDERIRTRLIALVEAFGQGKYKDEMLTYLEKQKHIATEAYNKGFADGTVAKRESEELEGQKEQTGKKWIYEDDYKSQLDAQYEQGLEDGRKEQKPAEWSEEDKHYFQNLIMAVDSTFSEGNTKNWLQNRFKSLRPQPHWKPSEEQMKVLGIAIRCGIQLGTWEEDVLCSLLDDLKNL